MKKLILLILSFYIALPAQAQETQTYIPKGTNWDNQATGYTEQSIQGVEEQTYIPKGINWENKAADVSRYLKSQSLSRANKMPAGIVNVSIVHPDYLEPTQFGLLMTKANSFTGCHEYSSLEYEAKYIEHHYMDINVNHFRRTLKETQNPEFDCNTKSKIISGLIIFNADDLRKKNIRQIRFSNGTSRDSYDVILTEDSIRLVPQSMIAFKAQDLKGPDQNYLEYNFADKSLITLQVPMAKNGEDVAQAVRNLAYKSALDPVFERNGLDTSGENHVFYFTDPSGKTLEQIGTEGYTEFGTIHVKRPYDGPNGRVGLPVPLKVFLARPNVTL